MSLPSLVSLPSYTVPVGVLNKDERAWARSVWGQGWANETDQLTRDIINRRRQFVRLDGGITRDPRNTEPPADTWPKDGNRVLKLRGSVPPPQPNPPIDPPVYSLLNMEDQWREVLLTVLASTHDPCKEMERLCAIHRLAREWCTDGSLYDQANRRLGWYGGRPSLETFRESLTAAEGANLSSMTPKAWFRAVCTGLREVQRIEEYDDSMNRETHLDMARKFWAKVCIQETIEGIQQQIKEARRAKSWLWWTPEYDDEDLREEDDLVKDVLSTLDQLIGLLRQVIRKIDDVDAITTIFEERLRPLWDAYIEQQYMDVRPFPMRWIREAIQELLQWTELGTIYEFKYGSLSFAEAGSPAGQFGWFRKIDGSPTPSEEEESEESDEED